MRTTASMFAALLLAPLCAAAEDTTAAKHYNALLDAYEREGGARAFAGRFLELAEQHPRDPAAADALLWVVRKVRGRPDTTQALELLAMHHVDSNKLLPACKDIANSRSIAAENLLRAVMEKNPDEQVRAQACYHLAALLDTEAGIVDQLRAQPELAKRILQYYGKEYGAHLASLKTAALEKRRERVYERMLKSFSHVEQDDTTFGEIAEGMLFQIRHLSVGKAAAEIKGEDIHGKEFKLSGYRGRVVMLSFWGHW